MNQLMPKGIKGFQRGNPWRFKNGNTFAKGGFRPRAGRPRDFTTEEERVIHLCPIPLRSKAYWYVIGRLKTGSMHNPNWTKQELRNHKFFIRVFRQGYGGGSRLALLKRINLPRFKFNALISR